MGLNPNDSWAAAIHPEIGRDFKEALENFLKEYKNIKEVRFYWGTIWRCLEGDIVWTDDGRLNPRYGLLHIEGRWGDSLHFGAYPKLPIQKVLNIVCRILKYEKIEPNNDHCLPYWKGRKAAIVTWDGKIVKKVSLIPDCFIIFTYPHRKTFYINWGCPPKKAGFKLPENRKNIAQIVLELVPKFCKASW